MNKTLVLIFIIFSAIFALSTLTFVVSDIVTEAVKKRRAPKPSAKPAPVHMPVVAPIVAPVPIHLPEIVDHIDAEEADEMITDDVALAIAHKEKGAHRGRKHFINLGVINRHFSDGDVVTLETIKAKGLIDKSVQRLKILADGTLTKPLTVKAESSSIQAINMIELTGGTVIILE